MKTRLLGLALVLLCPVARAAAAGQLRVVATVPELADLARRIGGDRVQVDSIARGVEDIHQVTMKPSFVTKLNRADAVVFLGLSVEHAFLPALLEAAVNPGLRSDPVLGCAGAGCIDCSAGIAVLDKPATLSRAEGDIHPQGNPHYNLDPEDGVIMARNIAAGLASVSPPDAGLFSRNLQSYLEELKPRLAQWRKVVAPLQGLKAVSYHKDVAYLGRFTGISFIDTVELKPGIGPTPNHLAELVKRMKAEGVRLIVREQQYDAKACEWLAGQTGARIAVVGSLAGAFPDTGTFIAMIDHNLKALLEAVGPGGR
ncbi:MAG: metal ABC transporter substrate-binding protein [Elusimicrobiota bacterium]